MAVTKGLYLRHLLSMLDFLLMLRVKLPVVDWIHPQSNKYVTGGSNLNDSPAPAKS